MPPHRPSFADSVHALLTERQVHTLAARQTPQNMSNTGPGSAQNSPAQFTHGLVGVNLSMDRVVTYALWFSLLSICAIILLARGIQLFNSHLRHVSSMGKAQQVYWQKDQSTIWPKVKKYLVYAPFWKKRHNREIRLSSALNFGTLPSRFHSLILLVYVVSNIAYCCALDYSVERAALIAEIRGRTGTLAVVNMIPLIILAGRNNPLIPMLRVSFDTYNLLHRWMGRIVVLESIAHTLAWAINKVEVKGWGTMGASLTNSAFIQWGAVGTFTMIFIVVSSPSAVRHAFYETFRYLHILAAMVTILGVYMHLKVHKIYQVHYIEVVVACWAADRVFRFVRIAYRNFSRRGGTTVTVQALPGDACRVTFDLPRPWDPKPGSHVYIYLPKISGLQSHPFSVAWSERHEISSPTDEKLPISEFDLEEPRKYRTSMSLVIQKRTGMTAKLNDAAQAAVGGLIVLRGAVEGPYGGLESLESYGTVVMFAGGIGITHQISHVRNLVEGFGKGTIATRKIVLVWIVRKTEDLEWVRPWMDKILQMPGRRDCLKILLFVTRPRSPREVISPSATVQMFPGRPKPEVILKQEIKERTGAMAVTVCGPGSLADSVRQETRKWVDRASIDFIEEAFTW